MKKLLALILMVVALFSFSGCSKTKTGTFELYRDDEFIGEVNKVIENGDMVCVVNNIYSYKDDFGYICWDKEDIDIIEID